MELQTLDGGKRGKGRYTGCLCNRVSEQGPTLGEKIGGKCKIKNDFLYNSKFMLSQNFYVSYNRTENVEISLLL